MVQGGIVAVEWLVIDGAAGLDQQLAPAANVFEMTIDGA